MSAQKFAIEAFVSKANEYASIEYKCSMRIRSWNGVIANVVLTDDSGDIDGECSLMFGEGFTMIRDINGEYVYTGIAIPADMFRLLYS